MEKCANIGLFFQKGYYKGITNRLLSESNNKEVEEFFKEKNSSLIKMSKRNVEQDNSLNVFTNVNNIELRTMYPGLITGIGMIHETGLKGETKLGMAFDYSSGLPIIPGSSVKGLLRSMFPFPSYGQTNKGKGEHLSMILDAKLNFILGELQRINNRLNGISKEDVAELAMMIFEGQRPNKTFLPLYERDIFFDALIEGNYRENGFLSFDFITPHKKLLQDPNPIQFLKIMPGVNLVFRFRLNASNLTSGLVVSADDKINLFKTILTTVGIGAKTNVGYGQLK